MKTSSYKKFSAFFIASIVADLNNSSPLFIVICPCFPFVKFNFFQILVIKYVPKLFFLED